MDGLCANRRDWGLHRDVALFPGQQGDVIVAVVRGQEARSIRVQRGELQSDGGVASAIF